MPTPIVVPQMGESVVEGTVGRWMKSEGDPIAKDETVVEIMTDKINVELPAIESGVLGKILAPEGTVVPVGADGMICVYLSSPMHLVVDLQGSFSSAGAMRFSAIAPERRLDTRLAMS